MLKVKNLNTCAYRAQFQTVILAGKNNGFLNKLNIKLLRLSTYKVKVKILVLRDDFGDLGPHTSPSRLTVRTGEEHYCGNNRHNQSDEYSE